eukprot:8310112-Ditylum_brightwellii.AAC.1
MGPSVTPGMPHSQHAMSIKAEPKDISQNTAKLNLPSMALRRHTTLMGGIWDLHHCTQKCPNCYLAMQQHVLHWT